MSEYQYYEFQAIDRPLGEADREALRGLSSRAQITATSFTNHYNYGDFKGNRRELMTRWFDLHLYVANWGTRQLMVRLPKRLLDRDRLDALLMGTDLATVTEAGENLILDICDGGEDAEHVDWEDGSGWLSALAPLRADLLSGDWRLVYLIWLTGVEQGHVRDEALEPLPGIAPLNGGLKAFADFFRIDADLVQAAAEMPRGCAQNEKPSSAALRKAIAAMPARKGPPCCSGSPRASRMWVRNCDWSFDGSGHGNNRPSSGQPCVRRPNCETEPRRFARIAKTPKRSAAVPNANDRSGCRSRLGRRAWRLFVGKGRKPGGRSRPRLNGAMHPATTARQA